MKRLLVLAVLVTICQSVHAQSPYGIDLQPGERLVSVNGVPINSSGSTQYSTTIPSSTTAQDWSVVPASYTTPSTAGSMYSGSDQQRAQAEAEYMAQNGIRGHVGGQIGAFEGCGWSTGGTPSTCTPGRAMMLTADATAHGAGGLYRVRAWR